MKDSSETIELNEEKLKLFELINNTTENYFITGKAGTGKSLLLQHLKDYSLKNLVVVAPTGVAALNVGGQTIHSLFLIPPTFIAPDSLPHNKKISKLLKNIEVLVIDEVSMVRADLMDAMDHSFRMARDSNEAFGGVQVIMFGDLYQLPPIVSDPELDRYFKENNGGYHFFNANVWKRSQFATYELSEVFRQKDESFKKILNAIRVGESDTDLLDSLNKRTGFEPPDDGYVYLTTNNYKANRINAQKLATLPTVERSYKAKTSGTVDARTFPTDENLHLKVGAQVMILRNDTEKRWINGTIGTVTALFSDSVAVEVDGSEYKIPLATWNKVRYSFSAKTNKLQESITSSFTQFPLRLAWALTIHKSQGKTFDNVVIDMDKGSFSSGQTYVALSRCTTLNGIYLTQPIKREDVIVDASIVAFMKNSTKPGETPRKDGRLF